MVESSPLLFLIYVNDFAHVALATRLYADGTANVALT